MANTIEIIRDILEEYYYENEIVVIVALVSLAYLLIFEKEVRKKYIIPLILEIFIVLNPILYDMVWKKVEYWRLFWLFSLHLLIGSALICLLKRIKYKLVQFAIFVAICVGICFYGTYLFDYKYEKTISLEKLPYGVVEICEEMLSLEDEPNVIADYHFSCNARQYSGKIKQLWGRNAAGYISQMDETAKQVYDISYKQGDMYGLLEWASRYGYNFIVTENERIIDKGIAQTWGYKEIMVMDGPEYTFHLYYRSGG